MKRFYIHSMGCKSNQFEGELIEEKLLKHGLEKVNSVDDADIFILNSCSVTHKSDTEAMYLLRNAKHKNPKITNILTGCTAQIQKENLLKSDFIDCIIGNNDKFDILKVIDKVNNNMPIYIVNDVMGLDRFNEQKITDTKKTRASLKIQDGCDSRCSYCIIPFARGKSRSANVDFVTDQIKHLENIGFHEVVFTGIHIGQWGKEWGLELLNLLEVVEEQTKIERYRLGSLNPTEINDELLDFLSKSKRFCPHFHLSLQSACNKTLRSMNRFYEVKEYLEQIDKINSMFNLPFLGSDIITGFAGETEDDFQETVTNLTKSGLTQIHTFPYSVRYGTKGAGMNDQVSDKIKEQRAAVIKKLSADKYNKFISKNLGTIRPVLIEKHLDKNKNILKGISDNYLTVYVDDDNTDYLNTIQNVSITSLKDNNLYGEII